MTGFSDYVIYADESGDHSLTKIDSQYPVFVLCLCLFKKRDYIRRIVPALQEFKFKWFGHDAVILHEREIRKRENSFITLNNEIVYNDFMTELSDIVERSPFKIFAAAIDKHRLKHEYLFHDNPYHTALTLCIENTYQYLKRVGQHDKITTFIFERRGQKEDDDLELVFRRISDGYNKVRVKLPNFEIRFVDKKANCTGMQLADLTARPIGLRIIRPDQHNAAFEIIRKKLVRFSIRGSTVHTINTFP